MKFLTTTLLAAAFLPATLTAQFSSLIGTEIAGVGDDSVSDFVIAGFAVTFPDGSTTSDIRIDSNGRITRTADADGSDFSETVLGSFGDIGLLDIPTIAPMWDDLSPQTSGGSTDAEGIWFYEDATQCNITWIDCEDFTDSGSYTFQCQLFADGRIVFCYDSRIATGGDGLVGLGDGTLADPGPSDLATATGSMTGFASVYESYGVGLNDLADLCLEFTPVAGEYSIASSAAGTAPTAPITFPYAGVCADTCAPTNRALNFTPDGFGGYTVDYAPGVFVDDSGSATDLNALAVGSGDDELYTQTLGFPFDMPGTVTVTDIVIDSNGRILADASDGSDFSASVIEMLTGAPSSIIPFWCDMSPQDGTFTFSTTTTEAYITMLGGEQFGEVGLPFSWQVTLRSDNSFQINLIETHRWRTGSGFTSDDVVIGCSSGTAGAGTDPGESILATVSSASNSEGTYYEFWDASFDENPSGQAVLDCDADPELGGTLDLTASGMTTGRAFTTLFFGFSNPGNLPLDTIGVEGGCLASSVDLTIGLSDAGNSASFSVALPPNPGFVGLLNLDLQVIYASLGSGETSLGAVLTNGVNVTFPL